MRQLLAFVQKEFRHILRDRWTTLILLCLPIVMLILFGFAITTEVRNTRVAVFDPSRDQATRSIVERLSASDYFVLARVLTSPHEIDAVFERGEVGLAVVFGEHFYDGLLHTGSAQVQLIADGADPNTAKTLINYATNIIASYQQELMKLGTVPYQISPEIRLLYNPRMKGAYNFVPGVMGMILMLICAMMTSISIAREKELGTMEVLLVSPIRPIKIILAKTIPYFVISVVDLTTILLLSVFVLDVPIAGSLLWLVLLSLIFIFLALALGILISSVVSSQLVALLISGMAMIMPVMMLSGMMFPVESMPLVLRLISEVVPAKWYVAAVRKIMIKGLGFSSITKELTILGSMALVLIAVSLKKHKARLE